MLFRSIILIILRFTLTIAAESKYPRQHEQKWDEVVNMERNVTHNQALSKLDKRDVDIDDSEELEEEFDYDYLYDSSEWVEKHGDRRKRTIIGIPGDSPLSTFIISGRPTNMYPWMVYINMIKKGVIHTDIASCCGSLISSKFVLTAAHCFQTWLTDIKDIHVILAEHNTQTYPQDCIQYRDGSNQCFNNVHMSAEKLIIHKQFNKKKVVNDIALIRLKGTAPMSEFILPIPLPTFDIDNPRNTDMGLTIVGWGYKYTNGESSPVQLETNVNLVPYAKCRKTTKVPKGKLCAIGRSGQDACHGDSGGPLMGYHRGQYFLAGIVSGKSYHNKDADCGSSVPTTYTNVYRYLTWILHKTRI